MRVLSITEAKMKLSELVEGVHATDERVMITRNGRPVAILLSPDDVASWDETIAVLSDPDLMAQIRRSQERVAAGGGQTMTVDELFDE